MKSLLIVEDDESLQKILSEKVAALGVGVSAAKTGQQALSIVKTNKPDLILLDIMLPGGMNGFDVLEQLKANTTTKDIPVIILTNLDTEKKTAVDVGAVDYIVKPNISIDDLVLKIKSYLQ